MRSVRKTRAIGGDDDESLKEKEKGERRRKWTAQRGYEKPRRRNEITRGSEEGGVSIPAVQMR